MKIDDVMLTPEEIGDNLDLEAEAKYPCSDYSRVCTVSVDKLLEAQIFKLFEIADREQKLVVVAPKKWKFDIDVLRNPIRTFIYRHNKEEATEQILALIKDIRENQMIEVEVEDGDNT